MNTAEQASPAASPLEPTAHSFFLQDQAQDCSAGDIQRRHGALTIEPCPSFRWIMAKDGTGKILAEVDQRFLDSPTEMADAFLAKIDALETPYAAS